MSSTSVRIRSTHDGPVAELTAAKPELDWAVRKQSVVAGYSAPAAAHRVVNSCGSRAAVAAVAT